MSGPFSVKGVPVVATGDVTTYPCRVHGIWVCSTDVNTGDIILNDSSAVGAILATIAVPGMKGAWFVPLDNVALRAITKLHCSSLPVNVFLTVFLDPPT